MKIQELSPSILVILWNIFWEYDLRNGKIFDDDGDDDDDYDYDNEWFSTMANRRNWVKPYSQQGMLLQSFSSLQMSDKQWSGVEFVWNPEIWK